ADEKLAARKAIVEGPLRTRVTKLNTLLTEAGPDGYLVGGRMTYADVAVYVMTSNIICGFFDGKIVGTVQSYASVCSNAPVPPRAHAGQQGPHTRQAKLGQSPVPG
ncbi:uncharacterized protein HaLaN_28446, partial [Haematococcus lacustris]